MKASFEKVHRPTDASFRCFERVDKGFPFEWHYHPEYELTLIVQSRGTRFIGDSIAQYGDGDLVLIGPDLPHTWCSDDRHRRPQKEHRAVGVQFGADFLGERFFHLPEMRRVTELLERSRRGLTFPKRVRTEVMPIIQSLPVLSPDQRLLALLGVMQRLSRTQGSLLASSGFRPSLAAPAQQRIDAVCRYLNDHFTSTIEHRQVAKLAHMSPASFSRFFKNSTGKTMTDYVNELRVGLACRLLIETDLSILEVCNRTGFNNFSNFSRRFRQIKGTTPREFRRFYLADPGDP